MAADQVVVEAVFAEGFFVDLYVAERTEEDCDVAELEAARLFCVFVDDGSSVVLASIRLRRRRAIAFASSRRASRMRPGCLCCSC